MSFGGCELDTSSLTSGMGQNPSPLAPPLLQQHKSRMPLNKNHLLEVGMQGAAQSLSLPALPGQAQLWTLAVTPISQVGVAGCAHLAQDIHGKAMAQKPALAQGVQSHGWRMC